MEGIYNLSTTTYAFHGLSLQSEAIASIIREKEGQRSNSTPGKDSQAMTSMKLFSHSEPLGAIFEEIEGLFNRITPFDIKHVIWRPFFFELGQNYYQASFSSHIAFVQI